MTIRSEKQVIGGVYAYNSRSLSELAYLLAGIFGTGYTEFYIEWLEGLYPNLQDINEDTGRLTPLEDGNIMVQLGFNEFDAHGESTLFCGFKI